MLGVAYLIHFIYKIVHFEYVQLKAYGERVVLFCPLFFPSPPSNKARVQNALFLTTLAQRLQVQMDYLHVAVIFGRTCRRGLS